MSKNKTTIPAEWTTEAFDYCFSVAAKLPGIMKSEYQAKGKFPVIDQGQDFISGYTEDETLVQTTLPVIVFGDHTRTIKFINFPHVLGNDGTKILYAKPDFDPKFLFHSLLQVKIPNTGYNRHFKYLESETLKIPPKKEQEKIAEVLSAVDEDIEKTDAVIAKTEKLKNGLMQQLLTKGIGHTKFKKTKLGVIPEGWSVVKLGEICDFTTGKLNSNQAVASGEYPFFTCSQETYTINKYSFDTEAILLAGNNANATYSVKYYNGKFDAYQRTYVITVKQNSAVRYLFLKEVLDAKLNELKNISFGTNTKFLTRGLLLEIEMSLPKIEEQEEIALILTSMNEKILLNKKNKEKLIQLQKGLMLDLLSGKKRCLTV